MRILVTGGAGFIASHIVDAYIAQGHDVVIVDNLSTGKKERINPQAKFYQVDITVGEKISEIFEKEKIDLVNHHAAQIDVRKSVDDPVYDAHVNVLGTLQILENCRKFNVGNVIYASSGGVAYGECGDIPPIETAPVINMSPYSVTKIVIERYLYYYNKNFDIQYRILRYANVYGPRQDPHGEAGVVAIFIVRMFQNKEVNIFGDGEQLRDYVFVDDVVQANLAATRSFYEKREVYSVEDEIYNIGTGKATSVNKLFGELKKITSYQDKAVHLPERTGELLKSFLDNSKACEKLGWEPKVSFQEGLKKTADWY